MTSSPVHRIAAAAAVALLLAGCATHAPAASLPTVAVAEPPLPRMVAGQLRIGRDVSVGACTGDGIDPHSQSFDRGVVDIDLDANTTAITIVAEWTPVNPTAARLNFTLWDDVGPGTSALAWRAGISPFSWTLGPRELAGLPRHVRLIPAGDACDAPGAYASAITDQDIAYRVTVG